MNGSKDAIFDQSITRGASALVDGVRLVLGMQRKEENKDWSIIFKIIKTNVCDTGQSLELAVDRINGGILIPIIMEVTKSHFSPIPKKYEEDVDTAVLSYGV